MMERGIKFEEQGLSEEEDRQWFKSQGYKTVPQIFDGSGAHIGGYDDLRKFLSD
jgi:glutaredoxin